MFHLTSHISLSKNYVCTYKLNLIDFNKFVFFPYCLFNNFQKNYHFWDENESL